MPRAKTKNKPAAADAAAPTTNGAVGSEVLSLAEAATYLRLPEDVVVNLVRFDGLAGRQVGKEWRFLKTALQDWLRTPRKMTGDEAMMASAGKFKDDPFLDDIVREAYRQRGRPVAEDSE